MFVGFDIGGTTLKYGLLDSDHTIIQHGIEETPENIEGLMQLLGSLWKDLTQQGQNVQAAGFGFPGIFSQKEQRIKQSPNFPPVEDIDLHIKLAQLVDVPLWIDNEANLAAFGEFKLGKGLGTSDMVLLTIGSGIGTGIILNGKIWRGNCGFAGELGHSPVNPSGSICKCGNQGCLETEVSASKIVASYQEIARTQDKFSAEDIHRKAQAGDNIAIQVFTQTARFLGIGIAILINLLNPEKILLGGGVMEASHFIFPPAIEEARRRSFRPAFECCVIEGASLGNQAGFIGAAMWAKHNLRF